MIGMYVTFHRKYKLSHWLTLAAIYVLKVVVNLRFDRTYFVVI